MEQVKKYIYSQIASKLLNIEDAKKMLQEIFENEKSTKIKDKQIAIIGMGCRFPGADTPDEFFDILQNKSKQIKEFPESRRKDTDLHIKDFLENKEECYRKGGYLKEIDKFDASLFNISPKEVEYMDPLQRIFMEVSYEALEDAGVCGNKIYGSKTGVYVGLDSTPVVGNFSTSVLKSKESYTNTGIVTSILPSRISYLFNLHGPSIVFDTACSSSLVALHSACKDIENGECSAAIVGGVSLFYFPTGRGVLESPDDTLLAFDKSANGTVWGEGIGAIVIKDLELALEDRDPIYAIIKGGAINNDGTSNGITAPNVEAQEELLVDAWKNARINPETLSFIEAHGTGTKLGDPIEIKAITRACRKYTNKNQFCGIGSIKKNIGHLSGASGIASIIKSALTLKRKMLLPCLDIETPNPYINFVNSPVYIQDRLEKWERKNFPRRCGVSSFGLSGTNCHVVLEEAPEKPFDQKTNNIEHIFTLTEKKESGLYKLLEKYKIYLEKIANYVCIGDICNTVNNGRKHYNCRIVIETASIKELQEKINMILQLGLNDVNNKIIGIYYKKHNIVVNKKYMDENDISEETKIRLTANINKSIQAENIETLGKEKRISIINAYIKGADVNWKVLYNGYNNVNLPSYSFEKNRIWVDFLSDNSIQINNMSRIIKHPLIDGLLIESINETIYQTEVSIEKQWMLREHKIMGNSVLPGTSYLEMMICAGTDYLGQQISGLKNVYFYKPLIVSDKAQKVIHTVIKNDNDKLIVTIASKNEENQEWNTHAVGEIVTDKISKTEKYNIKDILKSMFVTKEISENDIMRETVLQFGPRWKSLKRISNNNEQVVAYLELPNTYKDDINQFYLHPAIMDLAISIGFVYLNINEVFLPFSYKELNLYKPIPKKCYSYVRLPNVLKRVNNIITYDVIIVDEDEEIIADIKEFTLRRVDNVNLLVNENYYMYCNKWMERLFDQNKKIVTKNVFVVFKNNENIVDKIIEELRKEGNVVIEVLYGNAFEKIDKQQFIITKKQESYLQLFEALGENKIDYIINSVALDFEGISEFNIPPNNLYDAVHSLFNLTKGLEVRKIKNNLNIILLSNNAYEVTGDENIIIPSSAAMIGLGKVVMQENSRINIRCIDTDENTEYINILNECKYETYNYITSYRNNKRYIEVIDKIDIKNVSDSGIKIRENGVYIITGGMGGIGREISKYLSKKNKVHLILINRSSMPPQENWNEIVEQNKDIVICNKIKYFKEIIESGSTIDFFSIDITCEKSVIEVVSEVKNKYGVINGLIHSAGIAGDEALINRTINEFNKVLKPKMEGTYILDKYMNNENLDFFITFSSVASIFGGIGQGDYTAANSFLDSFTYYRNKNGKRTMNINWPAWKETGMAVDYGKIEDGIFMALSTNEAIMYFDKLLSINVSGAIVGELNYNIIQKEELSDSIIKISESILSDIRSKQKKYNIVIDEKLELNIMLVGKVKMDYTEMEEKIAHIWAENLKLEEIDIYDQFGNLGGDSIFAINIVKELDELYPNLVDVTDVFSHPTVAELAEFIESKIDKYSNKVTIQKVSNNVSVSDQKLKELIKMVKNNNISVEESILVFDESGGTNE